MAYEFKLPDLGEGLTEGEIARWLVTEGQELAEDDPLVEIQTDKTTVEIPSPAAGTVTKILVGEGEVVPVGTVLVVIGARRRRARRRAPVPSPPAARRESVPVTQGRVQATPIVRRIAQEMGVDLASLTGTGPNGRITEKDVRNAAGGDLVLQEHKVSRGPARAGARGAAPDRRAPDEGAPRGGGGDVRRGVRLHRLRSHPARPAGAEGDRGFAEGVPGAERPPRRRRDRLSGALRHRCRRSDRGGAGRPGRPWLRPSPAGGTGSGGGQARRRRAKRNARSLRSCATARSPSRVPASSAASS